MANITAADVNKLRQQTGAGMMDCKNALVEANGDFEMAIDILRKKGQKVAAKRADREASEGAVLAGTTADGTRGVIISLNCETDFVAKNDSFVGLATEILNIAINTNSRSVEELKGQQFGGGMTVAEKLTEQTGVIGEKIDITACEVLESAFVAYYIHAGNKLASIVGLSAKQEEAGRNVSMQVAAMNPVALNKEAVSEEMINRELEIGKELARQEGKPEDMLERIAQGRLGKFFKENTLVEQEYIKDNKMTIAQYLNSVEKGMVATGFKRVGLGV